MTNKWNLRGLLWVGAGATLAAIGCGGGGVALPALLAVDIRFLSQLGYTGDSSAITSGTGQVEQTANETKLTLRSGSRLFRTTLPGTQFVHGQTFHLGEGFGLIEYEEATRSHRPWHWLGVGSVTISRNALKGALSTDKPIVFEGGSPGNSTSTDPNTQIGYTVVVQPVSEYGALNFGGNNGSNAFLENDSGTTVIIPTGGSGVRAEFTLHAGQRKVFVDVAANPSVFVPNPNSNPLQAIRMEQVVGANTYVWHGTAGQVNAQILTWNGKWQFSINTVTMTADTATGATGSFVLGGVVLEFP